MEPNSSNTIAQGLEKTVQLNTFYKHLQIQFHGINSNKNNKNEQVTGTKTDQSIIT